MKDVVNSPAARQLQSIGLRSDDVCDKEWTEVFEFQLPVPLGLEVFGVQLLALSSGETCAKRIISEGLT